MSALFSEPQSHFYDEKRKRKSRARRAEKRIESVSKIKRGVERHNENPWKASGDNG